MKKFLTLSLAIAMCVCIFAIATFANEPVVTSSDVAYVDHSYGGNTNDGKSATTAVKMLSTATELLPNGGTIVV
ncbi:MAG: hypothetical protein IKY12_05590, partial [Clostridia bacterium]|nr:hypothetical protein [Clostridia bacterium]